MRYIHGVMPRLPAVVQALAGCFGVKIAEFASRTQDNRTIATQILPIFPVKRWSQKTIVMQINCYSQLAAGISPSNQ